MKLLILNLSIIFSFLSASAQQTCDFIESILVTQTSNEVVLQTSITDLNQVINCSWIYFDENGSCIGGDQGLLDTISELNQDEFMLIWQTTTFDSLNCTTQDTLVYQNNEWILIAAQLNEGIQGCSDSSGTTYDVGSEMFINECEYLICEGDDNWSDVMTIDNCFIIECIADACVDIGQFGQEGSYSSEEDCLLECGTSQELPYECLFGACVDISAFGQEGSYSSEKQCIEDCQGKSGELSFECIAGTCIDIGQFGQEGSYDNLGECEKLCQSNNENSSYECIADMCVDVSQFGQVGSYDNLEDCQIICEGAPASIKEISSEFLIAPNPFNSLTQIYNKEIIVSYNLFDIKARKVKSQIINSYNFVLNRDELPAGIYYLEIITKENISFNKLIIK